MRYERVCPYVDPCVTTDKDAKSVNWPLATNCHVYVGKTIKQTFQIDCAMRQHGRLEQFDISVVVPRNFAINGRGRNIRIRLPFTEQIQILMQQLINCGMRVLI